MANQKTSTASVQPSQAAQQPVCEPDVVTIKVPIDPANRKEGDITVGLNGKMYKIKRGIPVEVPKGVAEILEHSENAEQAALQYIDEASSKE